MASRKGPRTAWIREEEGAVLVRVHAQPGASRAEVGGVDPWRGALAVKVTQRATEGRANEGLCELIARAVGVPAARVAVAHGASGREKVVRIVGASLEHVRKALEGRP